MSQTLEAMFDGSVFRPDQPIEMEPNTRVRITIEPATTSDKESVSFLEVAESLNLEGPPDWSSRLDEYLYGSNGTVDDKDFLDTSYALTISSHRPNHELAVKLLP